MAAYVSLVDPCPQLNIFICGRGVAEPEGLSAPGGGSNPQKKSGVGWGLGSALESDQPSLPAGLFGRVIAINLYGCQCIPSAYVEDLNA